MTLRVVLEAAAQREASIAEAKAAHKIVVAWIDMADALPPTYIPTETLTDAIGPANDILHTEVPVRHRWLVTGGDQRQHRRDLRQLALGLLSKSERWRCDAAIDLTTATTSGPRLHLLDRFDVADLPSRRRAMVLRRAVTFDRKVDSVVVAGTLKKPMAKKPDWLQAVWIEAGHTFGGDHQKAA